MPTLNRAVAIAGFAFATLVPPAYGVPIPGGTSSSDDLLINFDLTDEHTSFTHVTLSYLLSSPNATGGDMGGGGPAIDVPVAVDVFSGLSSDSASTLIRTVSIRIGGTGVSDETVLTDLGVRDGLFSIGLRVAPNVPATANGVFAVGEYVIGGPTMGGFVTIDTDEIPGTFVTQDDPPGAVPEPATLALLGVGLACIGIATRRG